jgi:hypothetical protein
MLTFLHAADFHLDSPFAALAPVRPRRAAEQGALDGLATLRRRGAPTGAPGRRPLRRRKTSITETPRALAARAGRMKIPVFIAPGTTTSISSIALRAELWPENVHIYGARSPRRFAPGWRQRPRRGPFREASVRTASFRVRVPRTGEHISWCSRRRGRGGRALQPVRRGDRKAAW